MKPIVVLGSGGYAQELLWIIDDINSVHPTWDFLGFVDPGAPQKRGQILYDRPILGGFVDTSELPADVLFACGIGTPTIRRKECTEAERRGWKPATLVHPTVTTARHVVLGTGTVVGPGSILAPYAKTGKHCAINLHVTLGHNSTLGDYCVLSPGARISGQAILEDDVFIGTNATVYIGKRVGSGASLGANSFLLTNLAPGRSAIGIPATGFTAATGAGTCSVRETIIESKREKTDEDQ